MNDFWNQPLNVFEFCGFFILLFGAVLFVSWAIIRYSPNGREICRRSDEHHARPHVKKAIAENKAKWERFHREQDEERKRKKREGRK